MFHLTNLRAAAALAVLGAMALAGCGGGSSQSMLPGPALASNNTPTLITQNGKSVPMGTLSITLPNKTGVQAQSAGRAAALSTAKKPTFIDTTTANSAIVVSVTPQNAAEAAQYGNLTICYNLYTNGTLAPAAPPNFTYTNAGNTVTTVTVAIPAPPGTDGYQITQYAGQCGSTPYTIPAIPAGLTGSNILAQTPVTYADMEPGVVNNLNNQIANCPGGSATVACPVGVGPPAVPPAGVLAASVTIASVVFGSLPIANPVREQGAFLLLNGRVGVPIPLEAKDAAGAVIPGLTTPALPLGGAGPFPSGVTITSNDATNHTHLFLVDATTGAIAQNAVSNAAGITIHEFNSLSANTTPGLINTCGAGAASCNDAIAGGTAGDPWVIVMTFDGSDASILSTVTVTATATVANAALPTPITTVISPQSAVYTAGTGYTDAGAPAAGLSMLQSGANIYVSDGNKLRIDGTATVSPATGTTLGGIAAATWPNATTFIYAVDNAATGGPSVAEVASGLYAFNTATLAATPVSAAAGANNYITFPNPVAVVQATGTQGAGHPYLFVIDKNGGIYRVDISGASEVAPVGGFQEATNVLPTILTTGTAISPGSNKYLGTATLASGLFLVADPGNNRIAQVDATQNPAVITPYATGAPFVGLFLSGAAVYATSTSGQIYYISGAGAAPVSLGFATATAADGPIGQLPSLTPATTPALTPVSYPLQFHAGSFFDQTTAFTGAAPYAALATPYTLAPFGGTKAFAAAPAAGVGLIADTSAAAATGAGKVTATGGIVVVPAGAAATNTLTPDSIMFIDNAGAAGKLRTIVR